MSFSGLIQTIDGRNELAKAEIGQSFGFTHISLGDGKFSGSFSNKSKLENGVMDISLSRISRNGSDVILECDFDSQSPSKAFYFREVGIFANGKLCYYDNAGGDAEYIDPALSNIVKQKRLRYVVYISSEVKINATIANGLYALRDDLESVSQSLNSHITDKQNPHGTTKEQVGLGKVPDVATNDQTPTFTVAESKQALTSGDKLSILLGKIAKWIADMKDAAFAQIANNDTTTAAGYVADARIVRAHGGEIETLNTNLTTHKTSADHDDRYYTEAEMNTKLAAKSDTTHSHTWNAIAEKPTTFTPSSHTHDDRYYTEAEMNNLLGGKLSTSGGTFTGNLNGSGGGVFAPNGNVRINGDSTWLSTYVAWIKSLYNNAGIATDYGWRLWSDATHYHSYARSKSDGNMSQLELTGQALMFRPIIGGAQKPGFEVIWNNNSTYVDLYCLDSRHVMQLSTNGAVPRITGVSNHVLIDGVDVNNLHTQLTNGAGSYLDTGSIKLGRTGNYGWADWYYYGGHYGSIYAENYGFRIKANVGNVHLQCVDTIHLWNNVQYHGTFNAASSKKYKENIIDITEDDANAVLRLNPVEFDYIDSGYHSCGLIAEDTYDILPQIVSLKDSEPDSIDYIKLIPYMLKKMGIMQAEIDELREKIAKM